MQGKYGIKHQKGAKSEIKEKIKIKLQSLTLKSELKIFFDNIGISESIDDHSDGKAYRQSTVPTEPSKSK